MTLDDVTSAIAARCDGNLEGVAQFHPQGPTTVRGGVFGLVLAGLEWLWRRRAAQLPVPAYIAVTDRKVQVFSARFAKVTTVLGPVESWSRSDVRGERVGTAMKLAVPGRDLVVEAARPGEAERVMALLCTPNSKPPDSA
jgi:hypothetical protein